MDTNSANQNHLSEERARLIATETAKLLRELDEMERRLVLLGRSIQQLARGTGSMPPCNLTLVNAED